MLSQARGIFVILSADVLSEAETIRFFTARVAGQGCGYKFRLSFDLSINSIGPSDSRRKSQSSRSPVTFYPDDEMRADAPNLLNAA